MLAAGARRPLFMNERENKQIIQRAFDAWAAGTGSVFDLLAPNATWTIVGRSEVSATYNGRDDFMTRVIRPLNARLAKPLVPILHAVYGDGDMVIAYFDASATATDGKPYNNTYTWYLRMRDGLIVDAIAFFDTVEFNNFWTRVKV
jgi:ketosteroid isomerase-like protein